MDENEKVQANRSRLLLLPALALPGLALIACNDGTSSPPPRRHRTFGGQKDPFLEDESDAGGGDGGGGGGH